MLDRCGELLHAEHESAVTRYRDHRHVGSSDLDAQRRWKSEAQRALIAGPDIGAGVIHGIDRPGGEADLSQFFDEDAVLAQLLANHLEECPLGRQEGAFGVPRGLSGSHLISARGPRRVGSGHRVNQWPQCVFRAGGDGNVGGPDPVVGGRIDFDPDHRQVVVHPPLLERHPEIGTDRQDHVGVLPERVRFGGDQAQVVPAVEHTSTGPIRHHRSLEHLGQLADLGRGVHGAAADEDHGAFGRAELASSLADQVEVGFRILGREWEARCADGGLHLEDVHRNLEAHGPRPSGTKLAEGFGHQARGVAGRFNPRRPLGQRLKDAELIGDFVENPLGPADRLRRDLAGQAEHWRVQPVCGGQSRGAVQESGAGHHVVDRGLSGRHGVAKRHVAGALLVAGMQHADPVAGVEEGVIEPVVLNAGQAIDQINALGDERGNDGLATGELDGHLLSWARASITRRFTSGRPMLMRRQATRPGPSTGRT